jgi:4-aminobutyrate aminotransferase / (S)-3-amino-2-methylpropionate transaminase / 5-aminovalerate transaminase
VLVFEGAYHGRTNLTLAMTSKYGLFKRASARSRPRSTASPSPTSTAGPAGMSDEELVAEQAIAGLERALVAQVDPSALAAVVVEPVQGEGGFVPAPPAFLRRCATCARATASCWSPTRCSRGWGAPGACGRSSTPAWSPTCS